MAYTKKRVRQHIMEDRSIRIVREVLPDEWVVREYRPDYGIDLTIELFEYVDPERTIAATLGETLFVQVKSTETVELRTLEVHRRSNVEKGPLKEDVNESLKIEVAQLALDTSELLTVQAMGAAIPVLLFLVELSTQSIYFVCLNDLVEKVILPEDPDFAQQQTRTIRIPARNRITAQNPRSILPLGTIAKRPKLYAAFEKFRYQRNELVYAVSDVAEAASEDRLQESLTDLIGLTRHFLAVDLGYDFWERIPEWPPVEWSFRELSSLAEFLATDQPRERAALQRFLGTPIFPFSALTPDYLATLDLPELQQALAEQIKVIWNRLSNLSSIYGELVREWFLPTYLSHLATEDLNRA